MGSKNIEKSFLYFTQLAVSLLNHLLCKRFEMTFRFMAVLKSDFSQCCVLIYFRFKISNKYSLCTTRRCQHSFIGIQSEKLISIYPPKVSVSIYQYVQNQILGLCIQSYPAME